MVVIAEKSDLSFESISKAVNVDFAKWNMLPSEAVLSATVKNLESKGFRIFVAESKAEALEKIKELIPPSSEVMNGSSTTLIEIGFLDFLNIGESSWKSIPEQIKAENDSAKRAELRRKSVTAEYFLSSVNAIAETGELVACDASGSRVGAFPFAAKNLILVIGVNKIVPTLSDALKRVEEFAYPLENERAKRAYGMNSALGEEVIMHRDFPGRTTILLVKERLGF